MLPKTLEKTTVGILLDLSPVCGAPHIYFTVGRIGQIDNDVDNNGILHCWPWSSLGLIRERSGAEVEQGSLGLFAGGIRFSRAQTFPSNPKTLNRPKNI